MNAYASRMDSLMQIVRTAGDLAQTRRASGLSIDRKSRQDFVTQADKEVEVYLTEQLQQRYPDDGILGEENGLLTGSEGTWVIDPIDGTSNYIQGMDYWCISVGYMVSGCVQLGCIYAPDRDEFFHAIKDEGSFLNGRQLHMQAPAPGQAMVGLGLSSRRPLKRYLDVIHYLITHDIEYRRFGAGALMLAHTAAGQVDGYFEAHLNSWDATAGLLLVSEAGGVCCDFYANEGLYHGNPIWVASKGFYEENAAFLLNGNDVDKS